MTLGIRSWPTSTVVELALVRLDVSYTHPARTWRRSLVDAGEATLGLGTICGWKEPARSRGCSFRTEPCSVWTVFSLIQLRALPTPLGGACPRS